MSGAKRGHTVTWEPPDTAEHELRDLLWHAYTEAKAHPELKYWIRDERDPLTPVVWLRVDPGAPLTVPGEEPADG